MKKRSLAVLALVLLLGVSCRAVDAPPAPSPSAGPESATSPSPTVTFGAAKVLIDTDEGSVIVNAEKAETPEQRALGLMHRTSLEPDAGMVFLFFEERSGGFYMKDTLIPLSIAFFDSEGIIVAILDMEPCESDPCEIYDPGVAYEGALEVNQGAFAEWGVDVGDRITVSH